MINGTSVPDITPGGTFMQNFYRDSSGSPLTSIDVTGAITFTATGTAQERPSFHFQLGGDAAPVPEPTTMIAGALLLLPFGASALRKMRKARAA